MNQSILFPDIQEWDESKQVVTFPAQCAGSLIECVITKDHLESLAKFPIGNAQTAIEVFCKFRFDIEEQAEEMIEEERYNDLDQIEIK